MGWGVSTWVSQRRVWESRTLTDLRDSSNRFARVVDLCACSQDSIGLKQIVVVARSDLEVHVENASQELQRQNPTVQVIVVTGETQVDCDGVGVTETNQLVGGGAREQTGKAQKLEGRARTGHVDGLLGVQSVRCKFQGKRGLVHKIDTSVTVDVGFLVPVQVVDTDGTVVVDCSCVVVDLQSRRFPRFLPQVDRTVVGPCSLCVKLDDGARGSLRDAHPDVPGVGELSGRGDVVVRALGCGGCVECNVAVIDKSAVVQFHRSSIPIGGGNVECTVLVHEQAPGEN